jgi:hypothetical protein
MSHPQKEEARVGGRDQGCFHTVLEPVVVSTDSSGASVDRVAETVVSARSCNTRKYLEVPRPLSPSAAKTGPGTAQRKRTLSCPPASRSGVSGPWSLEWLQDHNVGRAGVIFSARKQPKKGTGAVKEQHKKSAREPAKTKVGGFLRHSLYSLKRIARLPINDRREVLQILQMNARKRRPKRVVNCPCATISRVSAEDVSSSSSVNNDWKHWVAM